VASDEKKRERKGFNAEGMEGTEFTEKRKSGGREI
jgi:hypothetical protein